MKLVNPYLNFPGNTEEAFAFYRSVFGGDYQGVVRYRDFPHNPMGIPEGELNRIAHISLPIGGENVLMGTDHLDSFGTPLEVGNNFYITLEPDSDQEAERVFGALSEGGRVIMPLGPTEWAEKYGMVTDRFGVGWMVNYGDKEFPAGDGEG